MARYGFSKLVKNIGETYNDFIARFKKQIKECHFFNDKITSKEKATHDRIRDAVILNIQSESLRLQILQMKNPDWQYVLNMVNMHECAENSAKCIQTPTSQNLEIISVKNVYRTQQKRNFRTTKCQKCGLFEHTYNSTCPAKNVRCFQCQKLGHFACCCRLTYVHELITYNTRINCSQNDDDGNHIVNNINSVKCINMQATIDILVSQKPFQFKFDTGASVSIIPQSI
ncbi:hypothetical protein GJ496_005219 [Pomphorhynchus laevis]|nr:hypothetical protein GJ496_005219 [Pomphorhynchus laevis]